ncbi:hypothetical protein XENOCAPTIV_009516, partial [Xenoophorus captivus]
MLLYTPPLPSPSSLFTSFQTHRPFLAISSHSAPLHITSIFPPLIQPPTTICHLPPAHLSCPSLSPLPVLHSIFFSFFAGLFLLLLSVLPPFCVGLCSRKKVAINKAAMSYRQEKSRKLSPLDCSMTEQSTLQQDERLAHSFMDAHGCSARNEQRSSVNESSSLLGGSPQRHCRRKSSPYHTGQLHPAVRVADLLQHINQMKTSEGYGFKQEYE